MIQAMSTVLDFAPAHWTASQRMVALALADRVSADLTCWPSIADISRRTGLHPRSVQRYLRNLEDEQVIERIGKHQYHSGSLSTNLWKWVWTEMRGVTPQSPMG